MEVSCMFVIWLCQQQWRIRLTWIDPIDIVHNPGLTEKGSREKLQIEACFTDEGIWNWFVQVQGNLNMVTDSTGSDGIFNHSVRIDHRIESGKVSGRIRKGQTRDYGVARNLAGYLPGYRLPLPRCGLETEISISRDPVSVHYDADTSLMTFWIEIVECHHVYAFVAIISLRTKFEILST